MNQQQQSTLAVTSLILGILSLFMVFFTGIPAIITGHKARKKIKLSNGILTGDQLARIGLILGYITTVPSLLILTLYAFLLFFAGQTGLAPFVYTLF